MSRRYRTRLVSLILAVWAAWVFGPGLWQKVADQWWEWRMRKTAVSSAVEIATVIVYPFDPHGKRWLDFAIPSATGYLKVLVNASVPRAAAEPEGQRWPYALDYELLDGDGKILAKERYDQETSVTRYREEDGSMYTAADYFEPDKLPTDGRLMLFNLTDRPTAKRLRLRLAELPPPLIGAAVRTYAPAKNPEFRLASLWQRLPPAAKADLARGNIYDPGLLTNEEKINLIRAQWEPLAPLGLRGRDYEPLPVYVRREIEGKTVDSALPDGVLVDANHDGIVAIPEGGGILRLQAYLPLDQKPSAPIPFQLRWYGRGLTERWTGSAEWNGLTEYAFEQRFQGGLLLIQSPATMAVRAILQHDAGGGVAITPPPAYVRKYLVSAAQTLVYDVPHAAGLATPLRLNLRPLEANGPPVTTQIDLLDNAGSVLARSSPFLPTVPSRLERLAGGPQAPLIAEAVPYYFYLPATVARIRISSDRPLLAAAYDQPPAMTKTGRVPEDTYADYTETNWNPGWFAMVPEQPEALAAADRVRLVRVQRRPPDDAPALAFAAGQYRWRDYVPEGNWVGNDVLSAGEDTEVGRDQALPSAFCALAAHGEQQVELRGLGRHHLSPTLIYSRGNEGPFRLAVWLDGALLYQGEHRSKRGAVRLAMAVPQGKHRLRVDGDGTLLLNHVADCRGPWQLRRRAFRLDGAATVVFDKAAWEPVNLTARLFTAQGTEPRAKIDVIVEGPLPQPSLEPRTGWTFPRRSYDIRPAAGAASAVLYDTGQTLDQGQMFVIPFDSDAPPGRYAIHLVREQGPIGYLSLSSLEPGIFDERRFFREEVSDGTASLP